MSDRRSIGYSIAVEAQKEGAELILTSFGRMMSITQMTAKKLDPIPEILEMDVQKPSDIAAAAKAVGERWDRIDGLVHSVAYAPPDALGGNFLNTPWESVATALQVSAFSFKELAAGFLPLMKEHGGSLITLDFDNSTQAWPKYDWMGVSKAALESVTRYLARDLGPVSYTHLRAHETRHDLVCRLLLEKQKNSTTPTTHPPPPPPPPTTHPTQPPHH